jgi:hypothetical protein
MERLKEKSKMELLVSSKSCTLAFGGKRGT